MRNLLTIRNLAALLFAATAGLIAITPAARQLVREADATMFGYRLTDAYAQLWGAEDWSAAPQLPEGHSTAWARQPVRIAHAMGSWGKPDENKPAALAAALAAGYHIIEVDLSYGPDGKLHCFHGPGGARQDDWPLEELLSAAEKQPFFIVLDLKSDFARSAADVMRRVRGTPLEERIIFQLYSPEDVRWFAQHAVGTHLPAPIVTLYRARRYRPHLLPNLSRIHARIVTMPIERVGELGDARDFATVLVHPLQSCADAKRLRVAAGYMLTDASCNMAPSRGSTVR
ncbi:hypothetical protein OMP43_03085 [Sphingomonas sp. CBMAI 2297]|uniref:hypothetical protein n=1 Tax=Sphingomonas sp. CBMAI 2297 TaxID=2991720 RepID=UPI002456A6DD|nr:hypothetical protein [Sphingomonas sp. CBMAI 2297]MDH4742998.1 hypothetical protein [Sphingomonas sp. CBMAI 2297]